MTASGGDPEGGPLTFAWDLDNNGSFETPGQSVTFSAGSLVAPAVATITVRVTDDGGLAASAAASVQVQFPFTGFFSPVDNLPAFNQVKGQGVPVHGGGRRPRRTDRVDRLGRSRPMRLSQS